jgi:hypothetical protein
MPTCELTHCSSDYSTNTFVWTGSDEPYTERTEVVPKTQARKGAHHLKNLDVEYVSLVDRAAVRDPSNPDEPQRFLL